MTTLDKVIYAKFFEMQKQLDNAGFKAYSDTFKYNKGARDKKIEGTIFKAGKDTEYNGEVLDIFEDGSFTHYSQFPENHPHYQPLKFKFS